jgi:hypothetical protein
MTSLAQCVPLQIQLEDLGLHPCVCIYIYIVYFSIYKLVGLFSQLH